MARSSRIGRGKVVVSCWTASACFLLYHRSLFGTEPWLLSTFSSCFALRRCFFMYLPLCLPSSEVPCFRRFFCSFSCCWCSCCCRCSCHCCICFPFFCSNDASARAPTAVAIGSDMLTRIWPPRLDVVRCGSNPISGRSPHVVFPSWTRRCRHCLSVHGSRLRFRHADPNLVPKARPCPLR